MVDGELPITRTRTWKMTERELLHQLVDDTNALRMRKDSDLRMIGYNVENFAGGFDIPFLRMRFLHSNLAHKDQAPLRWPFSGTLCFDLLPFIQKKLCTKSEFPPTLKDLDADMTAKIVAALGCAPATETKKKPTKADNQAALVEYERKFGPIDLQGRFEVPGAIRDCNTLDFVYDILGGPALTDIDDCNGEHMCGAKVPEMWAQYLLTHDETFPPLLGRYNASDVVQCKYVYDLFKEYLPKRDQNNLTEL
jgi:hypothetical protein